MSSILFHPLGEGGHINPTFPLARALRKAGHVVTYLCEGRMRLAIEAEGFGFAAYLPNEYPATRPLKAELDDFIEKDNIMWSELVSGRLEAQLAKLAPDLVLGDAARFETALATRRLGVSYIRTNGQYPAEFEPQLPPQWSDALPGELSLGELAREWRAWKALNWSIPSADCALPYTSSELYREVRKSGLHVAQVLDGGAYGNFIDGDIELVLAPACLDFPREGVTERVFAGDCLSEPDHEPWEHPNRRAGVPLVYCAFGGQSQHYPRVRNLLAALVEVARSMEIDVVVAGSQDLIGDLDAPSSVYAMDWAPQRTILTQADLFITHGGLGSIKEAIWEGVPLLVAPQAYDQRGNAARVKYHKIGSRILDEVGAHELGAHIAEVLGNRDYRRAAEAMQKAFREEALEGLGERAVGEVLAGTRKAVPSSAFEERMNRIAARSGF